MLYSCSLCLNWAETAASFALSFATMVSKLQFAQANQSFISKCPGLIYSLLLLKKPKVSNCPAFWLHKVEKINFSASEKIQFMVVIFCAENCLAGTVNVNINHVSQAR